MNIDTGTFRAITAERDELRDSNTVLADTLRQLVRSQSYVTRDAAELVIKAVIATRKPAPRHAARRGNLHVIKGGKP